MSVATDGEEILEVLLPIELTNGNDGRGSKWFRSADVRKELEARLVLLRLRRQPFAFPVRVHVTRILGAGDKLWDSSSIGRGNYKELEDAMVKLGWFHDDGPKWVVETRYYQDATRRKDGPAILIVIKKAAVA